MQIKPALTTILLMFGVSLLNVILIIGNFAFAVMVGCVIGIVSFGVIFRQFEENIGKKILSLILFQLTISCFSTIGLEIYCKTVHHQEWCNRNLFVLSSFPLYVSIVMCLLILTNWIFRRTGW